MVNIKVPNWSERAGSGFWEQRLEIMKTHDDNKLERSKMLLVDRLMECEGPLERLADLGCGIGRRHFQYPGFIYVGFDREKIMVEEAQKRFPRLTFHLCDGQLLREQFPQYENHFDVVTTFHVLQYNHVLQQEEIIRGISFLLRPRGYIYLKENAIYAHNNGGLYADLDSTESINGYSYTGAGWIAKFDRHNYDLIATDGMNGHFIFQKRS